MWLVQDLLVNYICSSTALNIRAFLAQHTGEVNMLSFSYGDVAEGQRGVIELGVSGLYAGPMTAGLDGAVTRPSFQDMVRAPLKPEMWCLVRVLAGKRPVNRITIP
jgi:hypothetical protein